MGDLLRGTGELEQIEHLYAKSFDFSGPVVLFPVRHHSPVCSYHLKQVIADYKPDIILVEGPENATSLIDAMVAKNTKAPFCIYLSYDDKEGKVRKEPNQYKAYYPFLEYSPELIAVRAAAKAGIPFRFIDLSYGEILINGAGMSDEVYEDEYVFTLNDFYRALTRKTGCQSFSELWELLFELEGRYKKTKEFVWSLFVYCYYSRIYMEKSPENCDLLREQEMKAQIHKACQEYSRVLVVTGGFHTVALARYLAGEETIGDKSIKRIDEKSSPVYLMPWSFEESDQAYGYQSGMVFPYYYQKVWENIEKKRKSPYEEAALKFIMLTASEVRKKQPLSIADEMQSYYMARGLAKLRQKRECGVYELIDAVKSSFIKGETSAVYQPALRQLYRLLTGMAMGAIDASAGVPPIVEDFLKQCRRFRIQTNTTLKKETRLDIYNKAEHRAKSRFFRQMEFLNTGFCNYLKSQEDNGASGRILLRESWEYRYGPQVQAALIDVSVYGATLHGACLKQIARSLREEHHTAKSLSTLLLQAWRMGLSSIYQELHEALLRVIGEDMDFLSVAECLQILNQILDFLEQFPEGNEHHTKEVQAICEYSFNRIFTLLYTVVQIKKDDEDPVCKALQYMFQYFINHAGHQNERYLAQMLGIYQDKEANGAVVGIAAGTLLKNNRLELDEIIFRFAAYINGTEDAKKLAVSFLKGFFMIAKDVIFVDDRLLKMLDEVLRDTGGEHFLEILPDLRLAFTYFLPFETDKIAKLISQLHGIDSYDWMQDQITEIGEIEFASQMDAYCAECLNEWLHITE